MARNPNLSTQVKNECKYISHRPGRMTFRPPRMRTVQLGDGTYGEIKDNAVYHETLGEGRNGRVGRKLDPTVPADALILEAAEEALRNQPWLATDYRYQLEIIGEYEASLPWAGYDEQDPDEIKKTYLALPEAARPKLESVMKFELERTTYDEETDEEVPAVDQERVKVLNELFREQQKAQAAASASSDDGVVDLD